MADILLLGDWHPFEMVHRIDWLLQTEPGWVIPFVDRLITAFPSDPQDITKKQITDFIHSDPVFRAVWQEYHQQLRIRQYYIEPLPVAPAKLKCEIPELVNTRKLAIWLGISFSQLENYSANWRNSSRPEEIRFRHYHYHWIKKAGRQARLIEAPKQRMSAVQRQIYLGILDHVPLHSACHGFRKKHSCRSYAEPHAGKKVVIHMDLEKFFTSISLRRFHVLFSTIGYSDSVARSLAGLCCNQTPADIVNDNTQLSWYQRKQLMAPHLPQGSPSSPALANLCAYKLDLRLAALAKKLGGSYTRYADDLAFSGDSDFAKVARYLPSLVAHIASTEGFSVNHRKTNIMHQGVSQRLTGMTLNSFPNYPRKDYDRLKAILFNSVRYGAQSQNKNQLPDFRAHLQGKIAYVRSLNPAKAEKLSSLFEKINWSEDY